MQKHDNTYDVLPAGTQHKRIKVSGNVEVKNFQNFLKKIKIPVGVSIKVALLYFPPTFPFFWFRSFRCVPKPKSQDQTKQCTLGIGPDCREQRGHLACAAVAIVRYLRSPANYLAHCVYQAVACEAASEFRTSLCNVPTQSIHVSLKEVVLLGLCFGARRCLIAEYRLVWFAAERAQ